MVLLEFSMWPLGKGESVGKYVARSLDIVDRSGLDYRLHAMGTVIEGEWDAVMALVKRCHQLMRRQAGRVVTIITIDDRQVSRRGRAGVLRMDQKLRSLEARLGARLA